VFLILFLLSLLIYNCNDITQGTFEEHESNSLNSSIIGEINLYDVYTVSSLKAVLVGEEIIATTDNGSSWQCQGNVTGSDLYAVFFANENTGWAVGNNGKIAKTTNFGNTWAEQSSGTSQTLKGVYFTNENTGWIAGSAGVILNTTDGGSSWSAQTSGVNNSLSEIFFSDSQVGWVSAFGSKILKTTNAGANWSVVFNQNLTERLHDIHFIDNNTGWAVGFKAPHPIIVKTTNSGNNWTITNVPGLEDVNSVYFSDENNGWICIENSVRYSSNGGANWSAQYSYSGTSSSIHFLKNSEDAVTRGWSIGDYNHIIKTSDGVNWERIYGTGIIITLSGTGSTKASVVGEVGGQIYNFIRDSNNPNMYYLSASYPLNETMEICVCTASQTGATTSVTTACYMNFGMTLISGCSTGCEPSL
jgi:photosystem II stability/assembly factor-like uncharacterized protein